VKLEGASFKFSLQADLGDIDKVVSSMVSQIRSSEFVKTNFAEIKRLLGEKVGRTYLWIKAISEEIYRLKAPTMSNIELLINELPTDLSKLYQTLLKKVWECYYSSHMRHALCQLPS
jgi:hypothetical protein